jgi:hypothetical protein
MFVQHDRAVGNYDQEGGKSWVENFQQRCGARVSALIFLVAVFTKRGSTKYNTMLQLCWPSATVCCKSATSGKGVCLVAVDTCSSHCAAAAAAAGSTTAADAEQPTSADFCCSSYCSLSSSSSCCCCSGCTANASCSCLYSCC